MFDPTSGTFVPSAPRPAGLSRRSLMRTLGISAVAVPLAVGAFSATASAAPNDGSGSIECLADLIEAGEVSDAALLAR